jgi:hypothetical protein
MPLTQQQMNKAFNIFINRRNSDHRYASFDYCYNYFNSFSNKSEIATSKNVEKSCLHIGSYLASWGMYRGSSFLLQEKSVRYYKELVTWFSQCPPKYWEIDVDNYNDENRITLLEIYSSISKILSLSENRSPVLVTKIMLGVFSNTPAFDRNFKKTFSKHFNSKPGFTKYNKNSLLALSEFYIQNQKIINRLCSRTKTLDFLSGRNTETPYTKAKIIDMIGFGHQIKK